MTPMEKAAQALNGAPRDPRLFPDQAAKRVIRVFLKAAAEDEELLQAAAPRKLTGTAIETVSVYLRALAEEASK